MQQPVYDLHNSDAQCLEEQSARLIIESTLEPNLLNCRKPLEISSQCSDQRNQKSWLKIYTICIAKKYPRNKRLILTSCILLSIAIIFTVLFNTKTTKGSIKRSKQSATMAGDDEPNPPSLPDSIKLFYPPENEGQIKAMQHTLNKYSDPIETWEQHSSNSSEKPFNYPNYTYTTAKHFSQERTALLFAPGKYRNLDFEIGYYSSVVGLGKKPSDVVFTDCAKGPHVPALEKFTNRPPNGSGLDTFWRSIENIASHARDGMKWTVSQAAPIRRVHVQGDLHLFDGDSWVSGGVAANSVVDGNINFGGQQQWLMRNVHVGEKAENGAWSLVFVGCTGNVPNESSGMSGGRSVTVESDPTVRVEKPYITLKRESHVDLFQLRVPGAVFGERAIGPDFEDENEDIRDFRRVKLGVPSDSIEADVENYSNLQQALNEGKDLVLSPGIYPLQDSLEIKFDKQVILGLGYATLIAPQNGSSCIRVRPKLSGVRIAGVMLEASQRNDSKNGQSSSLLQWGDPSVNDPGDSKNPGALSDLFARVGGTYRDVSTDVMVQLYSGNIYGDNLWLWRADHVQLNPGEEANFPSISSKYRQTVSGECQVKNGLVVHEGSSNVTMVGLAVEHTTEDQIVWSGDSGKVFFYQCELPYDADHDFVEKKYVGYRIGKSVHEHYASGLGIYSNFRDHDLKVRTAISHPVENDNEVRLRNIFTVKLDNKGQICSVVNGNGPGPKPDTPMGQPLRCEEETCGNLMSRECI